MRILVVSDSHGDFNTLDMVVKSQPTADVIVHCGDGAREVNRIKNIYPERFVVAVRGNCDLASSLPDEEFFSVSSKNIFVSHGNRQQVKFGTDAICHKACSIGADILLFGHTHIPVAEYENGLYIMNPGALRGVYGTFGIIDITDAEVVLNIVGTDTLFRD